MLSDNFKSRVSQLTWEGVLLYAIGVLTLYFTYRFIRKTTLKYKFGVTEARLLPKSYPFFSRNPYTFLCLKRDGLVLAEVLKFMRLYGHTWKANLGHQIVVTADPENIKSILATQFNDFVMGLRLSQFRPLLGEGVFTLDGHGWKQSRAMLRPNFSREKVAHTQSLEFHVQNLSKHIRKHNGQPFDIQEYFFRYTVDTSTEFLFGHSLYGLMDETIGETPPEGSFRGSGNFYESFNISQEICASRAWAQNLYYFVNPRNFKANNKIVHEFADFYISKALQYDDNVLQDKSKEGYIFLYELVKETRNPTVLRDQLLNIMIAGRDTTAGLLSMFFFEMSRNPDIFAKLKEEIYREFGTYDMCDPEDITFESLKKSEYLKWCINETLRMYPNVPLNFRCAKRDTTLPRGGGKDLQQPILIEKGTVVAYIISATHRDPQYYGKDSEVFRPERWGDKDLKPGWAFLPFNGGPRICLGQQFALTEASYTIVRLLQMFPNLVNEDKSKQYPPRIHAQLTLSLTDGAHVRMF
ncbi:hypothetical protein PSN45_004039 [Yamadazyma tenuis]|uniref:Cytochrome P450 52A13 (DH-ALK2) n=1 Tax=Candida tenuis (strain ATCC 10573 / BCRC 21748 / CBS 615 / JCM 9827 / NBRC 10315 / NRRL Y-1498 / VKM Y-70) TaxID=590646 RepID=G3B3X3_CANTC|nr:cytochrome P450 52A13 (DH-ALK2) [Yamadazyma tenuis ATCC 10573]XP_006686198.1 uncharacterized protein CANTEDRAFT_113909 [Yamadazyma tenuis ATCC 10573]EGV63883.1 cytochrome P450 52A13 (DH-ALK2) [Yamadazyma tenuis ATCC 10573]EGV63884.1 hypothetical protein CANTEDRAFT_113909 [Yamadazyma tenuis ATCC 10573]WEJ96500.1 hypothetical protein PSN45_004039 [Yamadazyma tenuis]